MNTPRVVPFTKEEIPNVTYEVLKAKALALKEELTIWVTEAGCTRHQRFDLIVAQLRLLGATLDPKFYSKGKKDIPWELFSNYLSRWAKPSNLNLDLELYGAAAIPNALLTVMSLELSRMFKDQKRNDEYLQYITAICAALQDLGHHSYKQFQTHVARVIQYLALSRSRGSNIGLEHHYKFDLKFPNFSSVPVALWNEVANRILMTDELGYVKLKGLEKQIKKNEINNNVFGEFLHKTFKGQIVDPSNVQPCSFFPTAYKLLQGECERNPTWVQPGEQFETKWLKPLEMFAYAKHLQELRGLKDFDALYKALAIEHNERIGVEAKKQQEEGKAAAEAKAKLEAEAVERKKRNAQEEAERAERRRIEEERVSKLPSRERLEYRIEHEMFCGNQLKHFFQKIYTYDGSYIKKLLEETTIDDWHRLVVIYSARSMDWRAKPMTLEEAEEFLAKEKAIFSAEEADIRRKVRLACLCNTLSPDGMTYSNWKMLSQKFLESIIIPCTKVAIEYAISHYNFNPSMKTRFTLRLEDMYDNANAFGLHHLVPKDKVKPAMDLTFFGRFRLFDNDFPELQKLPEVEASVA